MVERNVKGDGGEGTFHFTDNNIIEISLIFSNPELKKSFECSYVELSVHTNSKSLSATYIVHDHI